MAQTIEIKDLGKHITPEMEEKYFSRFERFAGHVGNGIYKIHNLHSTDTRELFLMFCAQEENIEFENS